MIVPPGYPLLQDTAPITLQQLTRYPIITYEVGYTGRSHIDDAFHAERLRKGAWLCGYAYSFVELFVPTLTRDLVVAAFT